MLRIIEPSSDNEEQAAHVQSASNGILASTEHSKQEDESSMTKTTESIPKVHCSDGLHNRIRHVQ